MEFKHKCDYIKKSYLKSMFISSLDIIWTNAGLLSIRTLRKMQWNLNQNIAKFIEKIYNCRLFLFWPQCVMYYWWRRYDLHYSDVIMASQITGVSIIYSTVCSDAHKRYHQNSASLAFVRRIHQWPLNSLHKGPVTPKMFPFDDIIMEIHITPW